ncbi:MAG: GldG family protein [Prochloraceae cyanobacterium]
MKTKPDFGTKKNLKYLFLSGPFIFIVGLVAGIVSGIWSIIPLSLILTGTIFTLLWLGLSKRRFWQQRSTTVGTNILISTLSVLIILGLINFLASRYSFRIDLTESQIYSLSPQTQQIVKNLNKPLTVWVFDRDFSQVDRELLENYSRYSPLFKFESVDPQVEVDRLAAFQDRNSLKDLSLGEVYLEYDNKKQLVQQLYPANNPNPAAKEPISELQLTTAIAKIKRDRIPYIYFLTGHGETTLAATRDGLSRAVSSLDANGYKIAPLNLVTNGKIPDNTTAIVISNPQKELFSAEIKLLRNYLNNGGRLLLMLDPDRTADPEPILQDWGIKLDDRVIIDASGSNVFLGFGVDTTVVTQYGDRPITKDFSDKNITLFYRARAIEIESKPEISAAPLLISDEQTWAESELNKEVSLDPKKDKSGPFNLAFALNKSLENEVDSRLVIFGDSDFATNSWISQQFNQNLFINAIAWLANSDDSNISIIAKEPKNRRLNIGLTRGIILNLLALLIFPLLALILAGITWWQRR